MTKFNEKNRKLLANVHAIKQSELSSFFDTRKFINDPSQNNGQYFPLKIT